MAHRILVTGATSGIGKATAERLLNGGHEVWASARSSKDLAALEEQGAHPVQLDLTDPASLASAVDQILAEGQGAKRTQTQQPAAERQAGLRGVVHNAGIGVPGAIEDLEREAVDQQMEVNLVGPLDLTRRLAPALRQAQGRIVFVSSLAALTHVPYYGAYCASKAALEAAADTLRLEMEPSGVRVSIVEPGPVATGFQQRARRLLEAHVDVAASPHEQAYERVDEAILDALPAVSVEDVAAAIERGLMSRRPPTRIPVGRRAWLGAKVLGWLPDRLQDRVLRWMFGRP